MTVVAHPLSGSPPLPVAPAVLAACAVALVAVVATRVRSAPRAADPAVPEPDPGAAHGGDPGGEPAPEGAAELAAGEPASRPWRAVTRAISALLLVLLVAVARFGPALEPFNLAAVATVNLVWPVLVVLAALLGPGLWRAVDPWRALASVERLAGAPPPAPAPAAEQRSVAVAVVAAAAWAVFLAEYAVSTPPHALATALAAYTLLLVAGSLALGRDRWLGAADAIGLLVTWTGRLRRGGLRAWSPPAWAAALLGAAFGGVGFARIRLTSVWGRVAVSENAVAWTRLAALGAVVAGAGLATLAARWARRRGAGGSVEAALVPVVAALAVAVVLRRAMVAAQLLPALLTDPFGRGWRLLGSLGDASPPDLNPWGTGVQQALAAGVVTLGALAGAWALARRVRGVRKRDPAALALYVATGLGVLAVTVR